MKKLKALRIIVLALFLSSCGLNKAETVRYEDESFSVQPAAPAPPAPSVQPAAPAPPALELKFECVKRSVDKMPGELSGERWMTVANVDRGTLPIIIWQSEHFSKSGYTPQKRCQEVSARLQEYASEGKLQYFVVDKMNGEDVLCVADSEDGKTLDVGGLLVTLLPSQDPEEEKEKFEIMRDRAGSGNPLLHSVDGFKVDEQGRLIINFEEYLSRLDVLKH